MRFEILPVEASSTVSSVEATAEEARGRTGGVTAAATTLAQDLANSSVVVEAVQGLEAEVLQPTGSGAVAQTEAATGGTSTALGHYSSGDDQMAAAARKSAGDVHRPDMPRTG
ncbi:hypothetical protein GCM10027060_08460 [Nesterenkonia halophila]|uniref:DUF6507 family protein n=1 Tax=Nesterenkonia halophila TaxID=302044 RepID=UPI00129093B8|nr:DUF6507 family protein [Nesterenkonia halophila]